MSLQLFSLLLSFWLSVCTVTYFFVRKRLFEKKRDKLKNIIHVNGTRYKSSITEIITHMLQDSGVRTIGKTTGTYPTVFQMDGKKSLIKRRGPANIGEQVEIVLKHITSSTQALVVECMALNPRYQQVSQQQMLKANIGIITNVKIDHIEEMGDNLETVCLNLCQTVPQNGVLITGEKKAELREIMRKICEERNTTFVYADVNQLEDRVKEQLSEELLLENVAIVLEVANILAIDEQVVLTTLESFSRTIKNTYAKKVGETDYVFCDLFAVNDVDSTKQHFEKIAPSYTEFEKAVLLSHRADRVDRTMHFLDFLDSELAQKLDVLYLEKELMKNLEKENYPNLEKKIIFFDSIEEFFAQKSKTVIFGIGNLLCDTSKEMLAFFEGQGG